MKKYSLVVCFYDCVCVCVSVHARTCAYVYVIGHPLGLKKMSYIVRVA